MLGSIDITKEGSVWMDYVEEAITSLNDENIYTLFAPYKNTSGYCEVEEQQITANKLIEFIEPKLCIRKALMHKRSTWS